MDKTLKALDTFLRREINRKHPDINYGGCCVFAALLAPSLKKLGKVKIRVQDFDTDLDAIAYARERVKSNNVHEWNDQGVHFYHVAIELEYKGKKYHVDACGVSDATRFDFLKDGLTFKEATELGNNPLGWNRSFNRLEVPMIKRRVNKFFATTSKKAKGWRAAVRRLTFQTS
jgi:hypothetical protein